MRIFFIITFSLIPFFSGSQNLVKNPGFEDYMHLPDLKYEFGERYSDSAFICKYWHKVPRTTPDYYHVNALHPRYSIPDNKMGHIATENGNAYVGLGPFLLDGNGEFIAGEFIQPLEPGKEYSVVFDYRFSLYASFYMLEKIEIYITKSIDWFETADLAPNYLDLINDSIVSNVTMNKQINNDGNWHKMAGTYKAKGGEKYIVFGMFYQNRKLERIMNNYINNNFRLGLNPEKYTQFWRRYKNDLFLDHNPNYDPEKTHNHYKMILDLTTETESYQFIGEDRFTYYFIDSVAVMQQ